MEPSHDSSPQTLLLEWSYGIKTITETIARPGFDFNDYKHTIVNEQRVYFAMPMADIATDQR